MRERETPEAPITFPEVTETESSESERRRNRYNISEATLLDLSRVIFTVAEKDE
jgi:hypothetical protein